MPSFPIPIAFHSQTIGFGGGERQLATLALSLPADRWQVHVIYQHSGGPWEARLREAGIRLYQLDLSSYASARAGKEFLRLRRYFVDQQIRICQGFDYTLNVFVTPAASSVRRLIALSTQRCRTELIPSKYRYVTRLAHRVADGVVTNSGDVASELTELNRIHLVPNAIDTRLFSPQPRARMPFLEKPGPVIGTISVLRPEKNISTLLAAFATLLREFPDATLLIVGDGPEKESLMRQAAQLGVAGSTVFRPATSDVATHLRSIDVFVLASISESSSNSLMEAMSCACAPVASDIPGNRELLSDAQRAFVFPARDAAALTESLARVLRGTHLRDELGTSASRHIETNFSIPAIVSRLDSLYLRLLSEDQSA